MSESKREIVLNLLPEIKQIQDEKLQEKVIACWEEAIEFRGWTEELLRNMPFTLLAENVEITFIDHVRAVCLMCVACDDVLDNVHAERKTKVNRDYLIAGALLADVGKLLEFDIVEGQPVKSDYGKHIRHPFSGVGLAFKHDLPSEVMHVIATHSKEGAGEKRLAESSIVKKGCVSTICSTCLKKKPKIRMPIPIPSNIFFLICATVFSLSGK